MMEFGKTFGDPEHHSPHDGDAIWLIDILVNGQLQFGEGNDIQTNVRLIDVQLSEDVFEFV